MSIVDEPADLQYPAQPQPEAPAKIMPHPSLSHCRPDEMAECMDGVLDQTADTEDGRWSLYAALWKSMDGMKDLPDLIDLEESAPSDAVGLNSIASVWDFFTPEQQTRINAVMAAHVAEWEEI